MFGRTQVRLAATLGLFGWGACTAPDENTDLRPAGPPEVLTVMVENSDPNDALTQGVGFTEEPTFCRLNDDKRPGHMAYPQAVGVAQICPDDLTKGVAEITNADPLSWYIRIEFDRLLNPDVEELVEIDNPDGTSTGTFSGTLKNTQPVTITCGTTTVQYDGYYSPAGNNVAWPLGPGLFIQPLDSTTIATGTECSVMVKDVVKGKNGDAVASDSVGPFKWKVDVFKIVAASIDPSADLTMPDAVDATAPIVIEFNALTANTSVAAADVVLEKMPGADCTGAGTAVAAPVVAADSDGTGVDIAETAAGFTAGTTYKLSFKAGATATDANGGTNALPAATDFTLCFTAM